MTTNLEKKCCSSCLAVGFNQHERVTMTACKNPSCPCHSSTPMEGCEINSVLSRVCERGTKSCALNHSSLEGDKKWEEKLEELFAGFFCDDCEKDEPHETVKCRAQHTTNFYWMRGQLKNFIRPLLVSAREEGEKKGYAEGTSNPNYNDGFEAGKAEGIREERERVLK